MLEQLPAVVEEKKNTISALIVNQNSNVVGQKVK